MPAHIFLQLGQWHDAAASDRSAFDASDAWIARKHLGPAMRNYHALAWLQYELLQLGRYRDAWATLDQIAPIVKASGDLRLLSDLSTMRARYVIETANWTLLASENNFGNANELFAIGVSAARSGNAGFAERARNALGQRAQDPREGDLRPAIAIMERELAALIALGAGRRDESIALLRGAAEAEAQLPAPLGLPAPIQPAPELLGEVLVEVGRPVEAIASFESVAPALRQPIAHGAWPRARGRGGWTNGSVTPALHRAAGEFRRRGHRPARAPRSSRGARDDTEHRRTGIVASDADCRQRRDGNRRGWPEPRRFFAEKKGPGFPGPSEEIIETFR